MPKKEMMVWISLRIVLGLTFLWAFFDKLFGLGFATSPDKSWLLGNSPTFGFLSNTKGIFSTLFQGLAGSALVDWLFMLGLLLIGLALVFGVALRLAGYSGTLLMVLMWLASIPPSNNPILDDHVVYALVLIGIAVIRPYRFGFGKYYYNCSLVKKYKILQ